MPIHAPGKRDHHNRRLKKTARKVVGTLSLTAMVDMFTVLTVFLLQNYNSTGQVINIPKEVTLPKASEVKELSPAHVVTISSKELLIDSTVITDFQTVKGTQGWVIVPLQQRLSALLKSDEQKAKNSLTANFKKAVRGESKNKDDKEDKPWTRITVQSDKDISMDIIKKVMATVTESGAGETNFAVTKKTDDKTTK